jgi:Tol biopolymer transport system component
LAATFNKPLALLLGAVCGIALVGGAYFVIRLREKAPPPPPVVRLAFAAPAGAELGAGDEPLDAAISPDERQVVFVATSNGVARLWRRPLDAAQAQSIAGTDGARLPAWKLTGRALAFVVRDRIKQVSLPDGAVRDLVDAPGASGLGWLPDGSLLFATLNRPIHRLQAGAVGDATTLKPGDRGHVFPIATGLTGDFVYTAIRDDGRRVVRLHAAGQDRDLTETTAHGQLVGDRLLFARQRTLLSQRLDRKTGTLGGRAELLSADVGTANGRGFFTASSRVLLTASPAARARQLVWFEDDRRLGAVGEPGDLWQVRLSPDDRFAAVTYLDPLLRTLDVMLVATMGPTAGAREPLTTSLAADSDPVWSPDGSRVLFRSLQDVTPNLYARRAHVKDARDELVMKSELDETPSDWREPTILFSAPMKATGTDVWQFDTAARELVGVATTSFNESDARFSPDGAWVTYVSDESGAPDIYASPFPEGDRLRVSFAGGSRPRWRRDGNAIFFVRGDQIMRADVAVNQPMPFAPAVPVAPAAGMRDFDVAHQSNRLLLLLPVDGHVESTVSAVVDW